MNAMPVQLARSWLTFCFDDRCKLTDRSMQFGHLSDAARNLFDASLSPSQPIDIACAIFCAPTIAPSDLKEIVTSVASIKLPWSVGKFLPNYQRGLWLNREPGA